MKKRLSIVMVFVLFGVLTACGAPVSQAFSTAMPPSAPVSQPAVSSGASNAESALAASPGGDTPPAKPADTSQLFVRRNTDGTDGGFERLIELMAQQGEPFYHTTATPTGMIAAGDVVLLFYNGQWDARGGTNTDLMLAVARAVAAHPDGFTGEIVIADNGQGDGTIDHARPNSANRDQSALDVVNLLKEEGVRATGYWWDDIMNTSVAEYSDGDDTDGYVLEPGVSESTGLAFSYPKFTTDYGTQISIKNGVWNGTAYSDSALKLINMPVLKSHGIYRATACVKNYMGMGSQNLGAAAGGSPHNSVGLGGMGEAMARSRLPVLNVLDMIYIGSRGGPWVGYEDASENFAIAAGIDPFALDYWAVKNVLMPEAERVGNPAVAEMDPDSSIPGSFGYWMNLSLQEMQKAGYTDFRFGEEAVVVYEA